MFQQAGTVPCTLDASTCTAALGDRLQTPVRERDAKNKKQKPKKYRENFSPPFRPQKISPTPFTIEKITKIENKKTNNKQQKNKQTNKHASNP